MSPLSPLETSVSKAAVRVSSVSLLAKFAVSIPVPRATLAPRASFTMGPEMAQGAFAIAQGAFPLAQHENQAPGQPGGGNLQELDQGRRGMGAGQVRVWCGRGWPTRAGMPIRGSGRARFRGSIGLMLLGEGMEKTGEVVNGEGKRVTQELSICGMKGASADERGRDDGRDDR